MRNTTQGATASGCPHAGNDGFQPSPTQGATVSSCPHAGNDGFQPSPTQGATASSRLTLRGRILFQRLAAVVPSVLLLGATGLVAAPSVGMEGELEIQLPGTLLQAKPVDPKAPLVLRVADWRPHGEMIAYDLRYIGLEAGQFDLREYLERQDGSPLGRLPAMTVEVRSVLPAEHDGILIEENFRPFPFIGGYKLLLIVVGAIWAVLIWPILRSGPRPTQAAPANPVEAPLTLADRLQPLVEQAARGLLGRDDQARLERLLLAYWRQKLQLEEADPVQAIRQLRQHPEAGKLLRQLEHWLHRPPERAESVDVEEMLDPYRRPAP